MSRRFIALSLLALAVLGLAGPVWADEFGTSSGWGERVEARVLDAYGRPIEGATVNVIWPITATKWGTTKSQLTNAQGRAYFQIDTYEFIPNRVNYTFYVNATYGSAQKKGEFDHRYGATSPRSVTLPVYLVTFRTSDRTGQPMSLDIVVDNALSLTTDSDGWGQVRLPRGTHNVSVRFGRSEQRMVVDVQDDRTVNASLRIYALSVRVIDDNGRPLAADVSAGGELMRTDAQGYVRLFNLTEPKLGLVAYYGNTKKEADVNLELFNQTVLVFDVHPPEIGEPQSVWNGTALIVRAKVQDRGDYASGLGDRQASVALQYTAPDEKKTKTVPMYTVGYNLFEAVIPLTGSPGDVRYTILATDADGNQDQSTDVFTIKLDAPEKRPDVSVKPVDKKSDLVADYGWMLGLLALMSAGGAYWYYISRKPPSGALARGEMYSYKEEGEEAGRSGGFKFPGLGKSVPKKK